MSGNNQSTEKPETKPAEDTAQSYGTEPETRDLDKPGSYGTKSVPFSEGDNDQNIKLTEK